MICQDVGPPDADIVLIGEAPGVEEERAGKPFVGAAGKMLRQMLKHAGIDYNACYTTNIMNVRPPGNQFKYFYEDKVPGKELEFATERLRNKVDAIHPKVIIPLGAEPLRALCNKRGIVNWRGTWLSFRDINVLPTYHPSYILRVYKDHPIVEMDFVKAVKQKPANIPHIRVMPNYALTMKTLDDYVMAKKRTAFDIETVGKHIRCIGFSNGLATISIPFIKFPSTNVLAPAIGSKVVKLIGSTGTATSYWSTGEEVAVLDAIQRLFSTDIEIVGQNSIGFDEPLLCEEFGLEINNHYMDTMHAFHCLYPEFPMGLNFLTSIYTDYPNYWTDKDTNDDVSEARYNGMDTVVTLDASYQIEKELKECQV